jgi:hypothetical protein
MFREGTISAEDADFIHDAATPEEAVRIIRAR